MSPPRKTRSPAEEVESAVRLSGEMLQTSLLAFLKNWNAYGYELKQRMAANGLPPCDNGTMYRTLRQLEKTGMVSSFWDTSENGPARRMYSLTQAGELFLEGWLGVIRNYEQVLRTALGEDGDAEAATPSTED